MQRNELMSSEETVIDIDLDNLTDEQRLLELAEQYYKVTQELNKHIDKALTAFSSVEEVEALIVFLDNHPEIKTLDLSHSLKANMKRSHHDSYGAQNLFNNHTSIRLGALLGLITIIPALFGIVTSLTVVLLEKVFGGFSKKGVALAVTKRLAMVIERNKTITSLKIKPSSHNSRLHYFDYVDMSHEAVLKNAILKNNTLSSADTFGASSITIEEHLEKNKIRRQTKKISQSLVTFNSGVYQDESPVSKIAPDNIKEISTLVLKSSLPKNASTFFKIKKTAEKIAKTVDDIVEAREVSFK